MKTRAVMIALIVGIAFYFVAKIWLALANSPDYIATFWQSNTVILAGLLLTDRRRWWLCFRVMMPAYFIPVLPAII